MNSELSRRTGRVFYRSIPGRLPKLSDFYPPGLLPNRTPSPRSTARQLRQFYEAVSVYDTLIAAALNAQENPRIGDFIVEVFVPDDGPVHWVQSGRNPHHYDLYGPFEAMLAHTGAVMSRFDVVM